MSKYIEQICPNCNCKTWHRQFKRFGRSAKGKGKGHKSLRRVVTWCCDCGYRVIDNAKQGKRRTHVLSFR